jgi:hypothetical protein
MKIRSPIAAGPEAAASHEDRRRVARTLLDFLSVLAEWENADLPALRLVRGSKLRPAHAVLAREVRASRRTRTSSCKLDPPAAPIKPVLDGPPIVDRS